jgi:hypothetical protein
MDAVGPEIQEILNVLDHHAGFRNQSGRRKSSSVLFSELSWNSEINCIELANATDDIVQLIQKLNICLNGADADSRVGVHAEWLPWGAAEAISRILDQTRQFIVRPPDGIDGRVLTEVGKSEYTIMFAWGNLLAGDISDVRIGIEMQLTDFEDR